MLTTCPTSKLRYFNHSMIYMFFLPDQAIFELNTMIYLFLITFICFHVIFDTLPYNIHLLPTVNLITNLDKFVVIRLKIFDTISCNFKDQKDEIHVRQCLILQSYCDNMNLTNCIVDLSKIN